MAAAFKYIALQAVGELLGLSSPYEARRREALLAGTLSLASATQLCAAFAVSPTAK